MFTIGDFTVFVTWRSIFNHQGILNWACLSVCPSCCSIVLCRKLVFHLCPFDGTSSCLVWCEHVLIFIIFLMDEFIVSYGPLSIFLNITFHFPIHTLCVGDNHLGNAKFSMLPLCRFVPLSGQIGTCILLLLH